MAFNPNRPKKEYKKHLKKTKNLTPHSRAKQYSTLRGFIIATISAQLKSQLQHP
ncbi:MAG: hypothetical protein IJU35_04115 [Paludibacteraceae bacterium]|nr:hypothetical protein [Paludibacteraceae bacterium]